MTIESHFESAEVTFTAGGALSARQLVKLSAADTVVECTANTDLAIGAVANHESAKLSGEAVSIRLFNAPGTISVIASVAIAFGLKLYPATDGKVGIASAAGSVSIGVSKNASVADLEIFEMLHLN